MGAKVEKAMRWAKDLISSGRVILDKADKGMEGVRKELGIDGEEEKKTGK